MIRAAWPDREPTWPAFLEGGAVLRITDADANKWLPRALRSALAWGYHRRNLLPPQPQPPHKRRRRWRPRRRTRESGGGSRGPPTHAPPTVRRDEGARATSRGREGGDNERRGEPTAPQPAKR